jgi:LysM repeat protein
VRLSIELNDELHLISTFTPTFVTPSPLPDIEALTYFPQVLDGAMSPAELAAARAAPPQAAAPSGITFFPLVTTGAAPAPDIVVITYTVHAGDQLTNLASSFNTTVEAIVALNPQIDTSTNDLRDGDVIRIPALQH